MREGGSLVSRVHQVAGRIFAKILKKHGIDELNPAQGRILYELWKEDSITQAELSSRTKLEKSTLAIMLDRLEEAGQVQRVRDPNDARHRLVRVTASNRALHGMTDSEIDQFENTLRRILANLQED
jgi:DNA-binding MarR family transcriptional regulator